MTPNTLQSTSWLAKRLGLSVSTIERLRARGEGELPPHITVGVHTIRYDVDMVEDWLAARLHGRITAPQNSQPSTMPAVGKTLLRKRLISSPAAPKDS